MRLRRTGRFSRATLPGLLSSAALAIAVIGSVATTATAATTTVPAGTPTTLTVSGTAAYGSKLTATPGTTLPGSTLTYQWYTNGMAIAEATATTYVPTEPEVGQTITVKVTVARARYAPASTTASAGLVAGATPVLTAPTVTGAALAGSTLTVTPGEAPPGATITYQWYENGVAIDGATGSTYTPTITDVGQLLTVTMNTTAPGYTAGSYTSAGVTVARATLAAHTPTISGTARVGKRLAAKLATWPSISVKISYKWLASGKAIKGATHATLKLSEELAGKKITVKVTITAAGYNNLSSTSKATRKVTKAD